MTRESVFVCRFISPRSSLTARVRAWDEEEAEQVFRRELAAEDLQEKGRIEVAVSRAGRLEPAPHVVG